MAISLLNGVASLTGARCIQIHGSNCHRVQASYAIMGERSWIVVVASITNAFVDTLGLPADTVQVWIHETPADSWGQGGRLTADK